MVVKKKRDAERLEDHSEKKKNIRRVAGMEDVKPVACIDPQRQAASFCKRRDVFTNMTCQTIGRRPFPIPVNVNTFLIVVYFFARVTGADEVVVLEDVAGGLDVSEGMVRRIVEEEVESGVLVGRFSNDGRTFITDEAFRKIMKDKLKDE